MVEFSRTQVDALGKRIRESDPLAAEDRHAFATYRAAFAGTLREVMGECDSAIVGVTDRTARLKTLESVKAKLGRGSFRLTQIQDIAGCRYEVPDLAAQDAALAVIQELFESARVVDYRAEPNCGYRAVHVVVVAEGRSAEIQLRTMAQNLWANESELLAAKFGLEVKYCGGPTAVRSGLERFSRQLHEFDETGRPFAGIVAQIGGFDRVRRGHHTRSGLARERALMKRLDAELKRAHRASDTAVAAWQQTLAELDKMVGESD